MKKIQAFEFFLTFIFTLQIPRGREMGREFIIKTLSEYVDGPLLPIGVKLSENFDT